MADAMGEDRSSFQQVRPWTADAFGFCKATEGTGWTDPTFGSNWAALKAEGKVRGAYHFFHPALSVAAQVDHFVSTVRVHGLDPGDILMADVEILTGADGQELAGTSAAPARMHTQLETAPPPVTSAGPAALEFLDAVAAAVGPDFRVLLYTDLSMAQGELAACAGYPLFIAYYAASPPSSVHPWPRWDFWQKEGGGGPGGGDLDYFRDDEAVLAAWARRPGPAPSPIPAPVVMTMVNVQLPTLSQGSQDPVASMNFVHRMQVLVAGMGRWNGLGAVTAVTDDGDFGPATTAALKAVQGMCGLAQDGVCGPDTWEKLLGA